MSVAEELVAAARAAGVTLATAESCTGGMVAAAITDVAGASAVFDRGVVSYANAAKEEMLGVSGTTLAAHGAVSEAVAREMAAGLAARSGAGLVVSITGVAGPGGTEAKPEGLVVFGLAQAGAAVRAETVAFGAIGRAEVRRASTVHALGMCFGAIRPSE